MIGLLADFSLDVNQFLNPSDSTMTLLQVATGFTGALTLVFLFRRLRQRFVTTPSIEHHFSPKGGCTDALVRELKGARHEILVQAYSFTSDPLTFGLIDAKKRGVDVKILLDKSNEQDEHSDLHIFLEHGLSPLTDHEHAIAHNKIMIVDGKTVITGSFNFTNQAEHQNAENLLIIKGHPELLKAYRQNFDMHKAHCKTAELKVAAAPRQHRAA